MTTATEPYLETFGCGLEVPDEDGDYDHGSHEGDCRWAFRCSQCRTEDLPCAVHAPREFPGLRRAECAAEPRHVTTWFYASDAYPPPCMYCAHAAAEAAHRGCEHSRHRAWRRWRAVHRLARWGYSLGFLVGYGHAYGDGCRGCLGRVRWGASSYLLGWDRWKWQTLPTCLRRRHWPSGFDRCLQEREMNFCLKCSPCPGCEICRPEPAAVTR